MQVARNFTRGRVVDQTVSSQPFVCSDTQAKLKHEEGYGSFAKGAMTQEQKEAARCAALSTPAISATTLTRSLRPRACRFPYAANPYEAADDLAARTRWLHTNMFIGGPMVPSGRTQVSPAAWAVHKAGGKGGLWMTCSHGQRISVAVLACGSHGGCTVGRSS